jgi:tetratricopeptide (TPR) repeat protein
VGERYQVGEPIDLTNVTAAEYVRRLTTSDGKAYWDDLLQKLYAEKNDLPMMENDQNVAVALVHLGRYREALKIFEKVEKRYSGKYVTAANLGTTYELLGQNDQALRWINEGLSREPESHYGTEWLHVKILEAKIALEKDSKWLERNSVLGIDWDESNRNPSADISVTDNRGQQKSAKDIEDALAYQLHERIEFVKPPDPVVAQLLFDLSNLLRRSRSPEHSAAIQQLAIDYGHKSIVPAVPATVPETQEVSGPVPSLINSFVVGACLLAMIFLAIGYYFYSRR